MSGNPVSALRYFELSPAEQRKRLDQRQAEAPHITWPMSADELAELGKARRSDAGRGHDDPTS